MGALDGSCVSIPARYFSAMPSRQARSHAGEAASPFGDSAANATPSSSDAAAIRASLEIFMQTPSEILLKETSCGSGARPFAPARVLFVQRRARERIDRLDQPV